MAVPDRTEWRMPGELRFEPDILLPTQWAGLYAKERANPHARLYLGILEEAIEDLRRYQFHEGRCRRHFEEARDWFRDWQGTAQSYPVTCEQAVLRAGLTIEPEVLAAGVLRAYPGWDRRQRVTRMKLTGNRNYLGPRRFAAREAAC